MFAPCRISGVSGFCFLAAMVLTASLAVAQSESQSADSSDWPQWRGPQRDGILRTESEWPNDLSADVLKQVWRVELGPSYSGPIVADGKVFTTESVDKAFEVVRAYELESGKQLWEAKWRGAMTVPFFAKANGDWIRSTPAYDDGLLYVGGMVDYLVCLDATNGEVVWQVDFPEETGSTKPDFGFVCSPLVFDGHVYVQAGGGLAKLEKKTGEVVWQSMKDGGGMMGSAFSSPIVATVAGKEQLLVQSRSSLAGVDIESGKLLWQEEVPSFRGMNILTPTVYGDAIFTSTYSRNSFLYDVSSAGGEMSVNLRWKNGVRGYMTSPVILDGHAYLHLQNRCLACLNLETGERTWQSPRYGQYSSLVAKDGKILALDQGGRLLLFNANPERFELVAEREISDQETWAHLAVSDDLLIIRELNALSVYRWKKP